MLTTTQPGADEADWVVSIRSLNFGFATKPVFQRFDWTIRAGITALMGPNGAGKTTLLRIVAGILTPSVGQIVIADGVDSARIGYLPQSYSFVNRMRVADAVGHAAWSAGIDRAKVPARVAEALARVDLTSHGSAKVGTLSGGQRQRLAIACTLSPKPALLLLDEPSVGLDPIQRRNLRDLLREIGSSTPIVLSTHLVDDVSEIADQVTVLAEGRVLHDGATAQFMSGRTLESAYVETITGART